MGTAIIIGVGPDQGLGAQLCKRFAAEGLHVLVAGRTRAALDAVVADIRRSRRPRTAVVADATSEADTVALFDKAGADLELAVYNAGNNTAGKIIDMTADYFEQSWRVVCFGGFLFGREAVRRMAPKRAGTLLFTGASASLRGRAGYGAFNSSKAGLRTLAQAMAKEYAGDGIHVGHVVVDGAIGGEKIRTRFPEAASREERLISIEGIVDGFVFLYQSAAARLVVRTRCPDLAGEMVIGFPNGRRLWHDGNLSDLPAGNDMPAFPTSTTVLDSILFRDAFGTPAMREVFSDFSLISRYAEVEVALAKAEARCGVIPAEAAEEIAQRVERRGARFRPAAQRDRQRRLSDPAAGAPDVEAMRRRRPLRPLGRDHAGHHGHRRRAAGPRRRSRSSSATSPPCAASWPVSPRRYRDTPMAGRTHLQQALPVTFGYKMRDLARDVRPPRRAARAVEAARAGRRSSPAPPARWPRSATRASRSRRRCARSSASACPSRPGTSRATAWPRRSISSASSPARSARSRSTS